MSRRRVKHYRDSDRSGLTLVELVVTLAITSVLAVSALAALKKMTKVHNSQSAATDVLATELGLQRLVELDLFHTWRYQNTENGFVLNTRAVFSLDDMEYRHVSGKAYWEIKEIDGRKWLVRRQEWTQLADDGTFKSYKNTELICRDVSTVRLTNVSGGSSSDAAEGQWQSAGTVMQVLVIFDAEETKYLEFTVRIQ